MTDQEPKAQAPTATGMNVDDTYEFSAPRFFDFIKDESEGNKRKAKLWFDCALAYAFSHREREDYERDQESSQLGNNLWHLRKLLLVERN
ncbi:protein TPX2 [Pyrus ussuriensis x Pyrus communis]|uniref:Protein TPX2 n=1 Tax=Pyrus ussuriensis x Pyrus communis TaxID=2448454 RepID=A0A5N5FJL3_9ROSA|nr:protein TPX2 [Pyrus ussuriensis x Pyrus communis]